MNIAEFNVSEMSDFELQGVLHSWLAQVKNRLRLEKLVEIIKPVIEEEEEDLYEDDWWDEMTAEQQADLTTSIGETEDPTKWTSHEDVLKMSRQWLSE